MDYEDKMKNILTWYSQEEILYEIVKIHKYCETVFMKKGINRYSNQKNIKIYKPVRWLKCFNVEFLKRNFDFYSFFKYPHNLFHSLAKYDNMPMFSFKPSEKFKQQKQWLENYKKHIMSFDYGIDIDSHDGNDFDCYKYAKKVKRILDDSKIGYSLKNTASGFHFTIPYENLPLKQLKKKSRFFQISNVSEFCKLVTLDIDEQVKSHNAIDKSVSDLKRFWASEYSVKIKKVNDIVCLPMSDEMFEKFKPKDYYLKNVLKKVEDGELAIRDRGLLQRKQKGDFMRMVEGL